jgi:hypothetical protein
MSATKFDIRQSETRVLQDQLNSAATTQMDSTLASINSELTTPGRLIAQSTPSLVVTVGAGTVTNPNTGKNRALPLINNAAVSFAGGTITFPSTSGTITTSPGNSASITIGANQFVAVLVQLDSAGNLNLTVGAAAGSLGAVVVPGGSASFLSLGYIIVQSNAVGTIQNITNAMLYQFVGGGGSGASAGGLGDDLDNLNFRASFTELFSDNPASSTTSVNSSAGFTNASYIAAKTMWQMSYDASKTIAAGTNSTTVVLSSAASYTVAAGDMIIVGTQAVKITAVNSQSNFTVETLNPVPSNGVQVTVSQAVHTKDIYNLAVDGSAISTAFPGTTMSEFMVDYKDNNISNSNLFTPGVGPYVAFTVSADNTNWSSVNSRPTLDTTQHLSAVAPVAGSSSYLRFFALKTSGTGIVNLIMYKEFMQKLANSGTGGVLNQAYAFTNGVGTPVNCSVSLVGGKTTITLSGFQYAVGVNSGQPYGSVDVLINGQLIPRYINPTLTPDASYTETSGSIITLDKDYSAQNLSVEILQRSVIVDTSTVNTTNISYLSTVPTQRIFTSGSGTYITPTSPRTPRFLRVRMVGGGGGGGGSGTASTGGIGGTGGNTTFGTALLVANGGSGGGVNSGGAPGSASLGSAVGVALSGEYGSWGLATGTPNGSSYPGGNGAHSPFFGGSGVGQTAMAGANGAANSGAGGGGGGLSNVQANCGGGGGSGGFVDALISAPSATYTYAVGVGGTAGTAGTSGFAGGAGGSGIIIVEEIY